MEKKFTIPEHRTTSLNKQDLIDLINNTFTDDCGTIAVLTECLDADRNILVQTITFGKILQ